MPLIISVPSPSPGQQACKDVARSYNDIADYLSHRLNEIVGTLSDRSVSAEFWSIQGTNGVAALTAFASARGLLQSIDPTKVSAELAAAGSTLVVNQDGTVTVPE